MCITHDISLIREADKIIFLAKDPVTGSLPFALRCTELPVSRKYGGAPFLSCVMFEYEQK